MAQSNLIDCRHCQKKHRISESCYPEAKAARLAPQPVPASTSVRPVTPPVTGVVTPATKVATKVVDSTTKVEGVTKMGRPKKYATDAERYRAYRARKQEQQP